MTRSLTKVLIAALVLVSSVGAVSAMNGRTEPRRLDVVIDAHFGHFTPKVIRAQRGDTIRVTLRSMDAAHGFRLQGHDGVDITAMPGMPAEVSFVVDWVGGREWYCTFSCGPQHGSMSGMIVATARD